MTNPRIGALQITSGDEYERPGEWAIEEFGYYGSSDQPSWAIPGWVEDDFGETGFFATRAAAAEFIEFVAA